MRKATFFNVECGMWNVECRIELSRLFTWRARKGSVISSGDEDMTCEEVWGEVAIWDKYWNIWLVEVSE